MNTPFMLAIIGVGFFTLVVLSLAFFAVDDASSNPINAANNNSYLSILTVMIGINVVVLFGMLIWAGYTLWRGHKGDGEEEEKEEEVNSKSKPKPKSKDKISQPTRREERLPNRSSSSQSSSYRGYERNPTAGRLENVNAVESYVSEITGAE